MTLDTFFKLFPAATVKIHGDQVSAENSGINNGVMGINHGTVNAADAVAILDRYRLRIQDEIIRSDVDPESKIKVLNIRKANIYFFWIAMIRSAKLKFIGKYPFKKKSN